MGEANDKPFLMAEWRRLLMVSYTVDPGVVAPYLPDGLEPDLFEGRAACSLVAFEFHRMRVLGVAPPGHAFFPELNLRIYVRDPATDRRGVRFVREFVPRRLVAFAAGRTYNEPYARAPMRCSCREDAETVRVRHRLAFGGRRHELEATGEKPAARPDEDSPEHWFKERRWGFGRLRGGETIAYRVLHPVWDVWPVRSWRQDMDAGLLFGDRWRFLNDAEPVNVTLAVGSPVEVFSRSVLEPPAAAA